MSDLTNRVYMQSVVMALSAWTSDVQSVWGGGPHSGYAVEANHVAMRACTLLGAARFQLTSDVRMRSLAWSWTDDQLLKWLTEEHGDDHVPWPFESSCVLNGTLVSSRYDSRRRRGCSYLERAW